ncbi:MAG: ferritin [Candidatus Marinimicrobia bacterium]|nr:ferritin [Candidatus Neomarinimicrobiota bacterium]
MLSKKLFKAFNDQIKHELESAYLYAAMVAWFKSENFDGMAHWMEVQSNEEVEHARKFFDHIFDRGNVVQLQPLNVLANKWDSPLAAFTAAYEHEQFVTGKINELMTLAKAEKDYAAEVFLHWFVEEQVEEEDSTLKIVELLKKIGSHSHQLIMIDRDLGKRE